jgi:hypothetical protein
MSDQGRDISRRRFVVGAARTGTAAGAIIWIAPKLTSVAFAADTSGSPAPGGPEPVEQGNIPEEAGPTVPSGPTGIGGVLPFTGFDPKPSLIAGGSAIVGGTLLAYGARLLHDPDNLSARPATATGTPLAPVEPSAE